jgi:cold shock CspA family protein/ribosome-associated translation inhibitor RaiA
MAVPLEITLRGVEPREEVFKAEIERQAEKLGKLYSNVMNCRVVVESPPGHKRRGRPFRVSVELLLPQKKKLVANREHRESGAHEEITYVVREAFEAARRQLDEHSRKLSREVKAHEAPPHGRVSQIFPDEGYGFIMTPGGYEIYFHRNSVVNNGFNKLKVGREVRFTEVKGDKGPQASTVQPIGKHHIVE